jgi:hypothetical protein
LTFTCLRQVNVQILAYEDIQFNQKSVRRQKNGN